MNYLSADNQDLSMFRRASDPNDAHFYFNSRRAEVDASTNT